jgi:Putative glycolipid-binding
MTENLSGNTKPFLEEALIPQSILWRGIHWPGHEACRLFSQNAEWHLEGTAVFSHDHQPCRLSYLVVCEENWNTLRARISGWVGDTVVGIDLVVVSIDGGSMASSIQTLQAVSIWILTSVRRQTCSQYAD